MRNEIPQMESPRDTPSRKLLGQPTHLRNSPYQRPMRAITTTHQSGVNRKARLEMVLGQTTMDDNVIALVRNGQLAVIEQIKARKIMQNYDTACIGAKQLGGPLVCHDRGVCAAGGTLYLCASEDGEEGPEHSGHTTA